MELTKMLMGMFAPLPLMVIGYMLYFRFRAHRMLTAKIIAKCTATLMCAAAAFAGLFASGQSVWTSLLFWGIVACVLGDGLLEIHFVSGMAAFGTGHVLLTGWIYSLMSAAGGISPLVFIIWAAAYVVTLIAFGKYLKGLGAKMIPFLLYPTLLMAMAAMALVLPLRMGARALCTAFGGTLFAVSDMFVAKGFFDQLTPAWDRFALAIYYIAVYCLAVSSWFL